ncbi:MAG: TetR family transcriptional regulator [Flavobacteriales bacterium]|nr:TetR family transcriptional regulator [Flavobacteriales bacterium]
MSIYTAVRQFDREDGYAKLTTKRLAERMQFSEAALYRHFASGTSRARRISWSRCLNILRQV